MTEGKVASPVSLAKRQLSGVFIGAVAVLSETKGCVPFVCLLSPLLKILFREDVELVDFGVFGVEGESCPSVPNTESKLSHDARGSATVCCFTGRGGGGGAYHCGGLEGCVSSNCDGNDLLSTTFAGLGVLVKLMPSSSISSSVSPASKDAVQDF